MRQILEQFFVYVCALWIGIFSLFYVLIKLLRNGFSLLKKRERNSPPEILSDKQWGNHHYITLKKQNIKLHYVEKGDPKNPLLLCLHGFPECWFSWRHQLKEFSSQFWVVAPDLRGYGESDKPLSISDYNIEILVQDVKELIQELGQTTCSVVAHDWGSVIAWKLVAENPHLFTRHICINGPARGILKQTVQESITQLLNSWYIFFFQCPFLPELIISFNDFEPIEQLFRSSGKEAFSDEVIDSYKYYAQQGGLKYPINYYRSSSFSSNSEIDLKISVPTLIIWGSNDMALSKEIPKKLTGICSDIQLKMVDGAGHFVHEEEHFYVNKLIWDYVNIT